MLKPLLFVLLVALCGAKTYERCEWARKLKSAGMGGYSGVSLNDWVCLTQHESSYNTGATNRNTDGSTDYGILQINSKYWCRDSGPSAANGCGVNCNTLLSSVDASITCAKTIVSQQGIGAWVAWRNRCQGRDLSSYTRGCNV